MVLHFGSAWGTPQAAHLSWILSLTSPRQLGLGDEAALVRAQADVDTVRRMLWGLINQGQPANS